MAAEACGEPDCPGFPLMSRNGQSFCVHCDALPDAPARPVNAPAAPQLAASTSLGGDDGTDVSSVTVEEPVAATLSSPPTSAPSSPVPRAPQPADLARRAQSDRASAEIGRLLLQGWTLLADECPNPTCFGVPLVRRPKPRPPTREARGTAPSDVAANVSKRRFAARQPAVTDVEAPAQPDARKLCVICGNEYLSPADAAAIAPTPVAGPSIPRKRSHDALEIDAAPVASSIAAKGKARARTHVASSGAGGTDAASAAVKSLEAALLALSGDLDVRTAASPRSPHDIAAIADAIARVASALSAAQTLR